MSVTGSTTEVNPSEAIKELLETADTSVWDTTQDPDVYLWQEISQSERTPGQGQPARIYTLQPTGAPLERLTADNELLIEEPAVEIWIYSLSESDTATLARNVISYFGEYMSDKYQNTEFADIVPSVQEDFRESKIAERTEGYVYMVEVQIQREEPTGVA